MRLPQTPLRRDAGDGRGFTLIELLIVVAIIGIIAVIAIPALTRARVSANEAAAIGDLRTAVTQYSARFVSCASPPPYMAAPKSGYDRGCTNGVFWAVPSVPGKTGVRGFGGDSGGRICFTPDGTIPDMTGACTGLK